MGPKNIPSIDSIKSLYEYYKDEKERKEAVIELLNDSGFQEADEGDLV